MGSAFSRRGRPSTAQRPSASWRRLSCRPSTCRLASRGARASRLSNTAGTTRTWSRRTALSPSPSSTSWAVSTGARPRQPPSRLPIDNGMFSAPAALASTSSRYSATNGTSWRPRLTYRAASTSPRAHRPRPQRSSLASRRRNRFIQRPGSEQHHIVLFLGVHALHLELDGAADEGLEIGDVARLLVEQTVDHLLVGQYQVALGLVGAGLAQDLAEDLVADGLRGLQLAAALAGAARLAEHLLEALAGALAGHLHQAQLGDADDVGLGVVPLQLLLQGAQHLALMLLVHHVDEVDDDDPAQVAQAQLAGDGGGGLEV